MEENIIDLGEIGNLGGAGAANTGTTTGDSNAQTSISGAPNSGTIGEEPLDPTKIQVTIGDKKSPIVMLFGARSSGKSMTLLRLANFLNKSGYSIVVDSTFRPGEKYRQMCAEFNKRMASFQAQDSTALNDFMLVKVVKNGNTICQFLEAPGEHYFDPTNIAATNFPPYLSTVTGMPNRKIWIFIAESNWQVDAQVKSAYVGRIANCKNMLMTPTDRTIILNNKIDLKPHLIYSKGRVHPKPAMQEVDNEYPGIFNVFKNEGLFSSIWRSHNCKYVPFTTGTYSVAYDGTQSYVPSADEWASQFWNNILDCLKG